MMHMKFLILTLYLIMIILLVFCVQKASSKKSALGNSIAALLVIATIIVLASSIYLLLPSKFPALLFQSIYFLCFDWLTICLLNYTEHFTDMFKGNSPRRIVILGIAVADSISFLLNPFFHHIFNNEYIVSLWNMPIWVITDTTIWFTLHLAFTYVIVFLCGSLLLLKAIKTPGFYRRKYETVLAFLFVAIILNAISLYTTIPIDISLFLYCIYAAIICYYSLFYKPKGLIKDTLSLVVSDMSDAVFCFDLWNSCVFTNSIADEMLSNRDVKETAEKIFDIWKNEYNKSNKTSIELDQTLTLGGEEHYLHVLYRKLFDNKRTYIGCFIIISDRTQEVKQFNASIYETTHDKLTGLYNRDYFFERVRNRLRENPENSYIMICSNIRGFKLFNDLFGIEKGDEVLKTQSELMRQHLGENDIYGRIAGDEFAVLVEKNSLDEQIFLKIINLMKRRFNTNIYNFHLYFGIYEITNNEEPVSIMCDKCKLAIEKYKNDYNTIFTYYDRNLLEKSLYERKIVGELEQAIENGEFQMYLQPQYSTHGNILGAEALVRWQHPLRGLIFPGDFIEVFEKTGVVYKLDYYMWEAAAAKLAEWKKMGFNNLYISVNISGEDYYQTDIYDALTSLVRKYDIDPRNMKLEITETVLMTKMQEQLELLDNLRDFGFLIEIDDFGSGYSSLNMLKDINVDVIKIDMGFLRNTAEKQKERSELILEFIIGMIKKLGMEVITEGVETKEHVDMLTQMECDVFQGYYFSKPIPVEEFEKLLY